MSISVLSSEDRGSSPRPASKVKFKNVFKRIIVFTLIFSFVLFSVIPSSAILTEAAIASAFILTLASFGISVAVNHASDNLVDIVNDLLARSSQPFSWRDSKVSVPSSGVLEVSEDIATASYGVSEWVKSESDGADFLELEHSLSGVTYNSAGGQQIVLAYPPVVGTRVLDPNYLNYNSFPVSQITTGTFFPCPLIGTEFVDYRDSSGRGIYLRAWEGDANGDNGHWRIYWSNSPSSAYWIGNVRANDSRGDAFNHSGFYVYTALAYNDNYSEEHWRVLACAKPLTGFANDYIYSNLIQPFATWPTETYSSSGLSVSVAYPEVAEPSSSLYVASPYVFTSVAQATDVVASVAQSTVLSAVSSPSLDEVLNVQNQILTNTTTIVDSLASGQSWLEYNLPSTFSIGSIWYYVVHWLHNISDFTDLVFGFLHQIPDYYTAPFYACVVLTLFCGVFRKMIGV